MSADEWDMKDVSPDDRRVFAQDDRVSRLDWMDGLGTTEADLPVQATAHTGRDVPAILPVEADPTMWKRITAVAVLLTLLVGGAIGLGILIIRALP